ncbi:ABC transporter ATP-binding protein [Xylocopilactobacillus apis]|uniref:ABC-type quaternary amine transporter n=1 Tax=Xylocopilactobacillus apis TaxID=2932183 RepID=A0AAU9D0L2_9LACO|nr:ABC transporter ATP-binding protein [Xylocopilactobacillus apis]BDR57088.1 glycine/betaine ABC transporter ATP-binding protein [Xylocopilactobacillus apis]
MYNVAIKFEGVTKTFQNRKIIDNLSFEVIAGKFITILGTSGSGKTTILKMINGLLEPDEGRVKVNGYDIKKVNIINLRRNIGYVVQEIGLFPQMTVEQNISVVPELLGWQKREIADQVNLLMKMIKLPMDKYRDRYPKQLSGGQQQRVGVARALAANPKIMLFDEPFGAVDAITRNDLQKEIKKIHQELEPKTFIFVTHDIHEALYLGDQVMIVDQGKISQFDTPRNIVQNPKSEFIKRLLDTIYQEDALWSSLK